MSCYVSASEVNSFSNTSLASHKQTTTELNSLKLKENPEPSADQRKPKLHLSSEGAQDQDAKPINALQPMQATPAMLTSLPPPYTLALEAIKVLGDALSSRSALGGATHDGTYEGALVRILQIESPTPQLVLKLNRVVRQLIDLYHPNIARFFGVSWKTGTPLCVVTEHAAHGTLASLLASDTELSLDRILHVLLNVARGMLYLHSQPTPILHRDLRAENIHLMHNFKAKVANFELSGKLGLDTSLVGTPAWTAPEILRGDKDYTKAIDVYSFGMLMLEILNRRAPYSDDALPPRELLRKVAHEAYRPSLVERDVWPAKLVELMEACWQHDPADRPAFADVVATLDRILSENR